LGWPLADCHTEYGLISYRQTEKPQLREAQLRGDALQHRGRQPAGVAQEIALPTQGAELHGEAKLVDHAAANGDLLQVRFGQREVFAQAFRIEGFWQLLSRLQTRGTAVLFDGNVVAVGAMGLNSG
jgi:hypothetical protein